MISADSNSSHSGRPVVGLQLMVEQDFLAAAYPLFEAGEVDVLEFSMDMGWTPESRPAWAQELLEFFSEQNRLLGHGVLYSPCSAKPGKLHKEWLSRLQAVVKTLQFQHVSEHFGVATGGGYLDTAPMPVPLTDAAVQSTTANMQRLKDVAGVRVGLENLALAFGRRDVLEQGKFLQKVLSTIDGFILLDLHNLFCQMYNFQLSADEILDLYPLELVREIHVAGGSFSRSQFTSKTIRRDTHDGVVPEEVFEFLPLALRRCPNVEYVIFERLGNTMPDDDDKEQMRLDYRRAKDIVEHAYDDKESIVGRA